MSSIGASIKDINNEFIKLKDSFNRDDMEGIRMTAHSIKGISGNYRMKNINEYSKLLGQALKEKNDRSVIEGIIKKLEEEILDL